MENYIDPIYKKYVASMDKALASSEFYEYYMSMIAAGKTNYQFTNRRLEKQVDETWVKAIEAVIKPMQEIIAKPRNFIKQDEIISNIALVKKVSSESIRHLSMHGSMVDNYDAKTNSVRPNRMMEFMKEDTWNTYENKFVYTLLEMAYDFVDKRYEGIFAALEDDFGTCLSMNMASSAETEKVSFDTLMKIQTKEDYLSNDSKNTDIFSRIARLHRVLGEFRQTNFAKTVAKFGKIKPPLVRTNAIAKHPNFKACHKLWDFILMYKDVGYTVSVYEQSSEIDDDFLKDIYHTILINYVILKNHLEQKKDRLIDSDKPFRKKTVIPHFNKEIIEEIVDNYDLPDVEVHKILNEEITMEKLMQAEHEERVRLVKEKEAADRARREAEEAERRRREKAEAEERLRLEKEQAREAEKQERERQRLLAQQAEEKARADKMRADFLVSLRSAVDTVLSGRDSVAAKIAAEKAAGAAVLEQTEKQETPELLKQQARRNSAEAAADREKAEEDKWKKQQTLEAQAERAKKRVAERQEARYRAAQALAKEKQELERLNADDKPAAPDKDAAPRPAETNVAGLQAAVAPQMTESAPTTEATASAVELPKVPDVPETPEATEAPEASEVPETPEVPEVSEAPEVPVVQAPNVQEKKPFRRGLFRRNR